MGTNIICVVPDNAYPFVFFLLNVFDHDMPITNSKIDFIAFAVDLHYIDSLLLEWFLRLLVQSNVLFEAQNHSIQYTQKSIQRLPFLTYYFGTFVHFDGSEGLANPDLHPGKKSALRVFHHFDFLKI